MGIEIERKFLVSGAFPEDLHPKMMVQGYIAREAGRTVRVRYNGSGYKLTIKGPSQGIARSEYEWTIADDEGEELLFQHCTSRIEKTRHCVKAGDLIWEIDVFAGENAGLIVAEVELPSADYPFDKPAWLGREVTQEGRFYNAALLDHPFADWGIDYSSLLEAEPV